MEFIDNVTKPEENSGFSGSPHIIICKQVHLVKYYFINGVTTGKTGGYFLFAILQNVA